MTDDLDKDECGGYSKYKEDNAPEVNDVKLWPGVFAFIMMALVSLLFGEGIRHALTLGAMCCIFVWLFEQDQ